MEIREYRHLQDKQSAYSSRLESKFETECPNCDKVVALDSPAEKCPHCDAMILQEPRDDLMSTSEYLPQIKLGQERRHFREDMVESNYNADYELEERDVDDGYAKLLEVLNRHQGRIILLLLQ